MIIDARNLNRNAEAKKTLPTVGQEKAKELVRLLDRKQSDTDSAEIEVIAPLSSGASSGGARTDTLDLSRTGYRNLQETKLEFAFDMEYTKDTALTNAWVNSQNAMFRLFGNSGKVTDEAVVGMSKDDFAEYMKTHELDKEIDWHAVDMQVWGSCNIGTFSKFTDHVGALYAGLEDRIKTDFEGEEQAAQLENLHTVYEKTVNEVIENVASNIERTFTEAGAPLPEGKLSASIRQVMNDKVNAYRGFIAKNGDYAGIKNTNDKWMARDIGFMTHALCSAYSSDSKETGENSDNELWNEKDIEFLGMYSSLYSGVGTKEFNDGAACGPKDEESVGLIISQMWLNDQKITKTFDVKDEVKSLCGKLFDIYANGMIDAVNRSLKRSIETTVGTTAEQFRPLDEKAVYAVLDVTKKSYAESGDGKTALVNAAAFARTEFLKKAEDSKLWRYNNDFKSNRKEYWNDLYTNKQDGSSMKNIVDKWEKFDAAISSKDMYKVFRQIGYGVPRT